MTLSELKQKFQQPYDRNAWQEVLRGVFPRVDIYRETHSVHCEYKDVESFLELGSVQLHDDKRLAILEIVLTPKKKIQRNRVELRNLVAKHIDQVTNHGVLVIFTGQNEDYRFTFTAKESEFNNDGEFVERQTATKRFTYLLGPHETCTTAARRLSQLADKQGSATLADVVEAFSVEKLNKEFFTLYKEHYATFVNYLLAGDVPQKVFGIPRQADEKEQDKANKPVRDFAKRLLGRLVFLYFLQKKGWLGCSADRTDWIDGDRNFVSNLFQTCQDKERFYSTSLVPLFFDALNRPDRPNDLFSVTGTRVPYLNGGLFEHEKSPNGHKPLPVGKLDFPTILFEQLLEFFGQYNFTIDENDPDDHEVGIDPEMLGHIFENLLEDNKDKGAFYTPKAVVQYMCQQSLINYLQQHLGERDELVQLVRFKDAGSATDKNNWIRQNARLIEELLDRLKICDPAIGSGAFPIGLLQEIYWIKLTIDWTLDPAETKLKIIQNSIYGVDIDAGAVEIARLRFWLSLIVDEDDPRPLPNLDYKIMQGDSLLESFEGIPLDNLQQAKGFKVEVFSKQGQGQMFPGDLLEYSQSKESAAKAKEISSLIKRYFGETNPVNKLDLHKRIDRFVLDHIDYNLQIQEEKISDELTLRKAEIKRKAGLVKGWKPPKKDEQRLATLEEGLKSIALKKEKLQELEEKPERPYFLWHLFFQDVFEQDGFDIVIGNPPYIPIEQISDDKRLLFKEKYPQVERKYDTSVLFFIEGTKLLKSAGILSYIAPLTWQTGDNYFKFRKYLIDNNGVKRIVNLPFDIFEAAYVDTGIYFITENNQQTIDIYNYEKKEKVVNFYNINFTKISVNNLDKTTYKLPIGSFVTELQERLNNSSFVKLGTITKSTQGLSGSRFRRVLRHSNNSYDFLEKGNVYNYILDIKEISLVDLSDKKSLRQFYAAEPKVLIRRIVNRQDRLSVAYTDKKMVFKKDINPFISVDVRFPAKYLLAILASKFISYFYINSSIIATKDDFRQTTLTELRNLPIPIPTDEVKKAIIYIVDQILTMKEHNKRIDISSLESEIDRKVYSLYKLSKDEISVVEANTKVTCDNSDRKTFLYNSILSTFKSNSAYFSLAAIKRAMADVKIELADDTLREYMSEAMANGIVSNAGRGWYSRHISSASLDPKPVTKIIRAVKKAFPLLDFCCWSTIQFNPFAQHLIAQPTIFLYAESDALSTVAETLKAGGWDAWADPNKSDAERFVHPGIKSVVLRPAISKQPEATDHVASIEKALVDLSVESHKLQMIDAPEVQRIIDSVLGAGLVQLAVLFGYSEVKREIIESEELTH
jgi:hypothetical protein